MSCLAIRLSVATTLLLGIVLIATGLARAQDAGIPESVTQEGKHVFLADCGACHGHDAKGNGPVAELLTVKPPDLTQLAKRAHGTFHFWRVYRTVDGRDMPRAHGTSDMPIWGREFQEPGGPGARERLLEVVFYLQSIQEQVQ
jgi:mono/diheme cytochrome c family protein